MKKTIPIDIWSVKEYGISEWLNKESIWPISERELLEISSEINRLYFSAIFELPEEERKKFYIIYKITVQYLMIIHYVILLNRLNNDGLTPSFSSNSGSYFTQIFANEKKSVYLTDLKDKFFSKPSTLLERINERIYIFRKQVKYDWINKLKNPQSYFKPSFLAIGYPGDFLTDYVKFRNRKFTIKFHLKWFSTKKKNPSSTVKFDLIISKIVSSLGEITKNHGSKLSNENVNLLIELTKLWIKSSNFTTEEITFSTKKQSELLLDNLGNFKVRCAAFVAQKLGHKIVGASHGNNFGMFKGKSFGMMEFTIVDKYIVPTKGAVELYSKLWSNHKLSLQKKIEFISINSNKYHSIHKINLNRPLPKSIETIMVLEYPLTEFRHQNLFAFWPYQLDINIRIALFFKKIGIKSQIKRHPDRLRESEDIYKDYYDEEIIEPFEQVYEQADAYFFPNLTTTTFNFALLTNRPIFFFETMLEDIQDEVKESLKKRCNVIPSWINEHSRLRFDEDAFAIALKEKPGKPDNELIRKYMFP